jgi:hypothetical protein
MAVIPFFLVLVSLLVHLGQSDCLNLSMTNLDAVQNILGSIVNEKSIIGSRAEPFQLHPSLHRHCVFNNDEKSRIDLNPSLRLLIECSTRESKLQSDLSSLMRIDMHSLSAKALVIWGFAPPASRHTHRFIHEALFVSAVQALVYDNKNQDKDGAFCVCWLDDTTAKQIDKEPVAALIEQSVVFTSPMYNELAYLPFSHNAKYIVHGKSKDAAATDRHAFTHGNVISIVVYRKPLGGDFAPVPPAVAFAASPPTASPAGRPKFQEASCATRTLNLPWACAALPGRIEAERDALTRDRLAARAADPAPHAVFVGSIWTRNAAEWVRFAGPLLCFNASLSFFFSPLFCFS